MAGLEALEIIRWRDRTILPQGDAGGGYDEYYLRSRRFAAMRISRAPLVSVMRIFGA
jgi:hypothetical protein